MTNNIKEGRIFYYVDISTGRRIILFRRLPVSPVNKLDDIGGTE